MKLNWLYTRRNKGRNERNLGVAILDSEKTRNVLFMLKTPPEQWHSLLPSVPQTPFAYSRLVDDHGPV